MPNKKPDHKESSEKAMNRRQFLVGGSAVLAAGAISTTAGLKSGTAEAREVTHPASNAELAFKCAPSNPTERYGIPLSENRPSATFASTRHTGMKKGALPANRHV